MVIIMHGNNFVFKVINTELMGAHTVKFNRIKRRERKIPKPNLELVIFQRL